MKQHNTNNMSIKIYKAQSILTVPIIGDGKILRYVEFSEANKTYRSSSKKEQESLESLPLFGNLFKLIETIATEESKTKRIVSSTKSDSTIKGLERENDPVPENKDEEKEVSFDTNDWGEAKDILRAEPYLVSHQSLRDPKCILSKATELGVSFPNLVLPTE